MAKTDWNEAAKQLRRAISLSASPIGVKLLPQAKMLLDYSNQRMLRDSAVCQMVSMARHAREEFIVGLRLNHRNACGGRRAKA